MMWNGKQNSLWMSGTRFSKALKTFQAHQAIFSHFYLKMKKVYAWNFLYEGNLYSY